MFNNGSPLTQKLTYARTNFGFDVEFLWYVFPATLAGIVVEILIPGEKQSWTSRLRAISIWAVYILIGVSVSAVLQYCLGLLHIHPLVLIDLGKTAGSKTS